MGTAKRRVEVFTAGCPICDDTVSAVPAVAVNGVLLGCCRRGPITAELLQAAGIGQA